MIAKPGMAGHLLGTHARVSVGLDTAVEARERSTGPLQAQPEVRAEDGHAAPLAEGAGSATRRGAGRAHGAMTQPGSKVQVLSAQAGQSLTQGN